MNEQTSWKCLSCGKTFGVNEWTCQDGVNNHVVEEKLYHSLDAPTDPGHGPGGKPLETSSYGQLVVCNIPPPRKIMEGSDVKWVGEGNVVFVRGRFATSNPEQQYWLNKKPSLNFSEKDWREKWLSQKQNLDLREVEMQAREQRLENDRNELLAQTKQKVGSGARA